MSKTVENRRIEWIDVAKGVGICLVVIGHIPGMNERIINLIYSFHMPFFFILTGILVSRKPVECHFREYFTKQFKKLLCPYYVLSVINILFLATRYQDLIHVPMRVIEMLSLNGYSALWFIPTLFLAKLSFFVLSGIYKKKKTLGICFSVVVFLITLLYSTWDMSQYFVDRDDLGWILKYVVTIPNTINRSLLGMIFIVIGVLTEKTWERVVDRKKEISVYVVIIIVAIPAVLASYNNDHRILFVNGKIEFIGYFLSVIVSMLVIIVCRTLTRFLKPSIMSFWGKNSMIILGTHLSMEIVFWFNNLLNDFIKRGWCKSIGVFVGVMFTETLLILFLRKLLNIYKS